MSEHDSIVTAAPAARSDEETAELMYGDTIPQTYGLAMQDSVNRLTDQQGWSEAERDAHVTEVSHALADARVPTPEAGRLHALFATYASAPPDDATKDKWYTESRQRAREQYGLAEGERRLKMARDFVQARPKFAAMLDSYGLGNNPDIVMKLIESPHTMKMTPRQRTPRKG